MNPRKFYITKSKPVCRDGFAIGTSVLEILAESEPNESRDELIERYHAEQFPAPPPKPVRESAPVIPDLLLPNKIEAWPLFDRLAVDAADAVFPKWRDSFNPAWLELTAAEALQNLFEPSDTVLCVSSLTDVVATFAEVSPKLETFHKIVANPICNFRLRAPRVRNNIIVAFSGSIETQMNRAMHAGRFLPLELCVYRPDRCIIESWFNAREAMPETLKSFAKEVLRLGHSPIQPTWNADYRAAIPNAECSPAPIGVQLLRDVGIDADGKKNLVIFKR